MLSPFSLLACVIGLSAIAGAFGISHAQSSINVVGQFRGRTGVPPEPWRIIQFDRAIAATQYQIREWEGVSAIQAQAAGSMALLARPVEVDLNVTPILCWRWRVQGIVKSADMNTKVGDDYAARVYVAFKLPADQIDFGLRLKLALARGIYGDHVPDAALNYVWDNKNPVGHKQFNAYTDRTQMIVQRSGAQHLDTWMNERVDILSDVTQAYGSPLAKINLLAVASDTDNTKETVQAGFADLHFVSRDQPCVFESR